MERLPDGVQLTVSKLSNLVFLSQTIVTCSVSTSTGDGGVSRFSPCDEVCALSVLQVCQSPQHCVLAP
jgi:hypothetical protein